MWSTRRHRGGDQHQFTRRAIFINGLMPFLPTSTWCRPHPTHIPLLPCAGVYTSPLSPSEKSLREVTVADGNTGELRQYLACYEKRTVFPRIYEGSGNAMDGLYPFGISDVQNSQTLSRPTHSPQLCMLLPALEPESGKEHEIWILPLTSTLPYDIATLEPRSMTAPTLPLPSYTQPSATPAASRFTYPAPLHTPLHPSTLPSRTNSTPISRHLV
ncbi:hypothetical protein DFP72DRAFT_1051565 [Ephemerocybe angulata]|uniref:Uncharacterized protein n=1 Tax=Ephemerocybe angulata TaxID=980116 RepID=A0A8H6HF37_9AGAR|nr:hypothetical protein DFP72DRAFT_1051565 [Tulosesus angulatus]